ncbi:putative uridylate kinase [Magnetofaba australis IT-1]|uniref:Uridylate kinase n=1 Tax=Magnetofaba australis IT-1 TaxID=1434232 RepID=A0A1Y2K728_9PROT|nr:putative uridylate kinase [Magnetofaba australis IT-1]
MLIKLSGEALMGDRGYGLDPDFVSEVASEIRNAHQMGVQIALVVGGGNIFRGVSSSAVGMQRSRADQMGMLATVINGLALQSAMETLGVETVVQTALEMPKVTEAFQRDRAVAHLNENRVVIFVAGTGNPFFTTDTAAALRACEIDAEILLKATKVDGVYSADPVKDPAAQRYDRLTFTEVLAKDLKVMDLTAITLCRENALPIGVFSIYEKGALAAVLGGQPKATIIEEG